MRITIEIEFRASQGIFWNPLGNGARDELSGIGADQSAAQTEGFRAGGPALVRRFPTQMRSFVPCISRHPGTERGSRLQVRLHPVDIRGRLPAERPARARSCVVRRSQRPLYACGCELLG